MRLIQSRSMTQRFSHDTEAINPSHNGIHHCPLGRCIYIATKTTLSAFQATTTHSSGVIVLLSNLWWEVGSSAETDS